MYHITTMNFKPWYYSHLQKKLLVDAMTFGTEGQGKVMGRGGDGWVRMRFCMLQCLWTFSVIMNGFFFLLSLYRDSSLYLRKLHFWGIGKISSTIHWNLGGKNKLKNMFSDIFQTTSDNMNSNFDDNAVLHYVNKYNQTMAKKMN